MPPEGSVPLAARYESARKPLPAWTLGWAGAENEAASILNLTTRRERDKVRITFVLDVASERCCGRCGSL